MEYKEELIFENIIVLCYFCKSQVRTSKEFEDRIIQCPRCNKSFVKKGEKINELIN